MRMRVGSAPSWHSTAVPKSRRCWLCSRALARVPQTVKMASNAKAKPTAMASPARRACNGGQTRTHRGWVEGEAVEAPMFASPFPRAMLAASADAPGARRPPASLGPSAHVDPFTRDNSPAGGDWPDLLLERAQFQYPDYLNAAVELTERMVERGFGDNIALIGNGRRRTYKELSDWTNRLAHALVEDFGVKPGNRVLIRSGNNPAMVAAWLAATKADRKSTRLNSSHLGIS